MMNQEPPPAKPRTSPQRASSTANRSLVIWPFGHVHIHLVKKILVSIVTIILVIITLLVGSIAAPAFVRMSRLFTVRVVIAAGESRGESYIIAKALQRYFDEKRHSIHIEVKATAGTQENLTRLKSNQADIAAAQADVAFESWTNAPDNKVITTIHVDKFQLLTCLPNPPKEILARNVLTKRNPNKPPIIVHLPIGGGQQQSFKLLAQNYRFEEGPNDDYILEDDRKKETPACIPGEHRNIIFRVRAEGNEDVTRAITLGWRLVHLPNSASIRSSYRALNPSILQAGTYRTIRNRISFPEPPNDIETIDVSRLLIANANNTLPGWVIHEITKVLNQDTTILARYIDDTELEPEVKQRIRNLVLDIPQFNTRKKLEAVGLPLHPNVYDPQTWMSWMRSYADLISALLALATILATLVVYIRQSIVSSQQKNIRDLVQNATRLMLDGPPVLDNEEISEIAKEEIQDIEIRADKTKAQTLNHNIRTMIDDLRDEYIKLSILESLFKQADKELKRKEISEESFRTFNQAYQAVHEVIMRRSEDQRRDISAHYVGRLMKVIEDVRTKKTNQEDPDGILTEATCVMKESLVYSRDSFRTLTDAYQLARMATRSGNRT